MAYINIENMEATKTLWSDVKDGDIVSVEVNGVNIETSRMGKLVQHVTVSDPKNDAIVGFGGNVTIHFGPGEQPVSWPEKYDEKKDVYITIYK